MIEKVTCTMVFEVDRAVFKSMNPLNTETPWGIPYAVSIGDALEEGDKLREELDSLKTAQGKSDG
jgi:hypothetical protein